MNDAGAIEFDVGFSGIFKTFSTFSGLNLF